VNAWRNWSGELVSTPARLERPRSTAEVAAAIARSSGSGSGSGVVRVAGAGHSFSDLVPVPPDGTLLRLDAMDRILDVDRATGLVRVQAGIRLRALSDRLAEHGLAFENLGDINVQSLAGAIATGTHGTGAQLAPVHANVVALQLVDGTGETHELTSEDDLRAARVSLGALGVVTEVTLRCVPLFTLRGVDEPRPLEEVLASLDELADGAEHFEFYVFPHTDVALTRTNNRVEGPPRPPRPARRFLEDVALTNGAFGTACRLARARPSLVPALNRSIVRLASGRTRVDRSDRVFASPRLVHFTEMEVAVDRAHIVDLLRAAKAEAERHPVPFPMEVRFVAADDSALLSPAHGRPTAYLASHQYRGMPAEPFLRAVHAIADGFGARPHWGKRHWHTAETLAPRYPGWEAFQALRARLDPEGTFASPGVARVLGRVPVGAAAQLAAR